MNRFVLILAAFISTSALAQGADIVAGIPDIPLMPGFTEAVDETVIYDKPEGRIVFASASNSAARYSSVLDYYRTELLERGWLERRALWGDMAFQRTGELLEINIEPMDGIIPASPLSDTVGVRVSFQLSPL